MYQRILKKICRFITDRHYVLIKDFNAFMYDHTLLRGRKHCHYCFKLSVKAAFQNVMLSIALKK